MGIGNLPDSWTWTTIGELADRVTKGSTPTSYGFKYQQQGISFVKTENIVENGTIQRITDFIDDETNRYLSRSVLQPYDILGTVQKSPIWGKNTFTIYTKDSCRVMPAFGNKRSYWPEQAIYRGFRKKCMSENCKAAIRSL